MSVSSWESPHQEVLASLLSLPTMISISSALGELQPAAWVLFLARRLMCWPRLERGLEMCLPSVEWLELFMQCREVREVEDIDRVGMSGDWREA